MTPARQAHGYTLMEVLIALGIFAIGFVAVAAMFPAATHLQRETIQDVTSQQFARGVEAMLTGRPFLVASLPVASPTGDVEDIDTLLQTPDNGGDDWTYFDRSAPVFQPFADRSYLWVPLVRCDNLAAPADPASWQVYVFALKRERNTTYPSLANDANPNDPVTYPRVHTIPVSASGSTFTFNVTNLDNDADNDGFGDQLMPGDQFLDSNGTAYTVKSSTETTVTVTGSILMTPVSPTNIWFSLPGATGSGLTRNPTQRIFLVAGAVQ
jgi:prepilin-type N-terminal cleavage/methylation domain-containing protein